MSVLFIFIGVITFAILSLALVLVSDHAFKGSLNKKEGIYYLKAAFFFGWAMFNAIAVGFIDHPVLATTYFVAFVLWFSFSVGFALKGADIGNKSYNKIG